MTINKNVTVTSEAMNNDLYSFWESKVRKHVCVCDRGRNPNFCHVYYKSWTIPTPKLSVDNVPSSSVMS